MPRPDGEPTNFELIEQGLARLDPETRHEVIGAMLAVAQYRRDRAWLLRQVLAPRGPGGLPPFRMLSSGI
jgi:hypothetical protein